MDTGFTGFTGFTEKTIKFYRGLAKNNDKAWFEKNREIFDNEVMKPARAFVLDMGSTLASIAPGVIADPRVNQSIFKIHRDVRFGKDRSPFKTNLGLWFWEGPRKRMECSGFYLQLMPDSLMLGVGIYMFPPALIKRYREAAVDPKSGKKLAAAISAIAGKKKYGLGGEYYKKVPAGYDPRHENAELLKYNGLWGAYETGIPKELYSAKFISYCLNIYRDLLPLHQWLVKL